METEQDFDSGVDSSVATAPDVPPSYEPSVGGQSAPTDAVNPPAQSEPGYQSPYEAFRALPEFQGRSDLDIARELYSSRVGYQEAQRQLAQYQRLVPYAEYGQRYASNAEAFERWQAEQAKASQAPPPPQPEQPKWWNPPQLEETYKSYIIRDPSTGREMIDPNAPLHAKEAIQKFQDYTANFARKLVTDPENTLKPFVEQVAAERAKQLVEEQLNGYKTQNFIQDLERQNADWLYEAPGVPSREGEAVRHYIAEAAQMGISDPNARWKYATSMLRGDLLMMQRQMAAQAPVYAPQYAEPMPPPMQAPPPAMSAEARFLRERATRKTNRSAGASEPRAPQGNMSFEQRLLSQFEKDGVI